MNVTDTAVGPDGSGFTSVRGKGGAFPHQPPGGRKPNTLPPRRFQQTRHAAWRDRDRGNEEGVRHGGPADVEDCSGHSEEVHFRLRALSVMQELGRNPTPPCSYRCWATRRRMRHAVWLLGVNGYARGRDGLVAMLGDPAAGVRALVRAGFEPPIPKLCRCCPNPIASSARRGWSRSAST
jgi:hypothetical protein